MKVATFIQINFMGIFDFWFKKHGHRKDKIIQELLAEIKRMDEKEQVMVQNERRLIKDVERLERWLYRCQHPPKRAVTFDVVFS